MSQRSALFLSIAQRSAQQGDVPRAIVVLINALQNHPSYIESHPESIELLASLLIPGFEEELCRLEARHPIFGTRLRDALIRIGKAEDARRIAQHFDVYCIEQMKYSSRQTGEFQNGEEYDPWVPEFSETPSEWHMDASCDRQSCLSTSILPVPTRPIRYRGVRTSSSATHLSDTDGEGTRRFDRIRTQTEPIAEAPIYADTAGERVILDFDDCIATSAQATLFAPSQMKFRTLADDVAQMRTLATKRTLTPPPSPAERVAEVAHALSETPSVEPYATRHPWRFHVSQRQIFVCVCVCVICIFTVITWKIIEPDIEKRSIEEVSASYIRAAELGEQTDIASLPEARKFIESPWMKGHRAFLETWRYIHFTGNQEAPRFPEDMQSVSGAEIAAQITLDVSHGHRERAQEIYERTRNRFDIWHDHAYFRLWAEGQIDEAAHLLDSASSKYEKLLHTPLAPFALTQLGSLAVKFEDSRTTRETFLRAMHSHDDPPALARCALAILERGQDTAPIPHLATLKSPFAETCALGRLFIQIADHTIGPNSNQDIQIVQNASTIPETARFDALIKAYLQLGHTQDAVTVYRDIPYPENHPLRIRMRRAILVSAFQNDDWDGLYTLFEQLPKDMGILAAARVIDTDKLPPDTLEMPYALVKYGHALPRISKDDNPFSLDAAYLLAISGNIHDALAIAQQRLRAHPEHIEPLLAQSLFLANSGRGVEAAEHLERAIFADAHAIPMVVLANLYRMRAQSPMTWSSFMIPLISFADPVLESARCEILWRGHDRRATSCLSALTSRPGTPTKDAWIMQHLDPYTGIPNGTPTQWARADTGAISFPGYHLAYARVLSNANETGRAAKQYEFALLDDPTSSTTQTIHELEKLYTSRRHFYEGAKKFESIIAHAEQKRIHPSILGELHLSAAHLYPADNSEAKKHLSRALELLGHRNDIIQGFIRYYKAKDKPESAAKWRSKLQ